MAGLATSSRRHRQEAVDSSAGRAGTALVTGASSGIGAVFARQLAARGYDLILVARREKRLAALATELEQRHPIAVQVVAADLSDPTGIGRVERHIAELAAIDILVNCAGFGAAGTFVEVGLTRQLNMIQVHVVASVRLSRAVIPGMIARGSGAIINVSSLTALMPGAINSTYSATKAYLLSFSESNDTSYMSMV